jgi:hypothetical protein
MAIKVDGAKKKAKVVARDPIFIDEKAVGGEPVWDTERALKMEEAEFDHQMRVSLRYYNYFYSSKDLKKYLVEWLKQTAGVAHKLDAATITRFAKSTDGYTPLTAPALIKAHTKGMPLREREIKYIINVVNRALELDDADVKVVEEVADPKAKASKIDVKAPTIQDRMNAIADKHQLHFLELEDELFTGKTVDPKAYDYLIAKNVAPATLARILAPFDRSRAEFAEARKATDEDTKDAYAHLKAADYKRLDAFYTALFDGFAQYGQVKKATKKAAVRKPPQKEKLVAKLKYLKNDTTTKAVSINPVDIIGAQVLWIYNTKTRKLGKYVAEDMGGALNVKGTTITGYDETKSVSKTLRKPEAQIKEFLAAGKIDLRKFLENIKATEVKLNGRINQDTILLKIQ